MCLNFSKWSPLQASHRDVFSGVLKDLNNLSFLASSLVIPMKRWERVTGHPLLFPSHCTPAWLSQVETAAPTCLNIVRDPFLASPHIVHTLSYATLKTCRPFLTLSMVMCFTQHCAYCLLVLEREDLSNGFKGIKWGNSFSFLSHQTISLIGRLISLYVCRLKMWRYNIHSFYISR